MNFSVIYRSLLIYASLLSIKLVKSADTCPHGSLPISSNGGTFTGDQTAPVSHNGTNQSQQSSEIKILIKDPNDENKIIEFDNTLYSTREEGGEIYFDYKEAVKYMSIKFGSQEVWKYDETKFNGNHPVSISYVANKKLFVHFEDEFIAYQKRTDGEWKESPTLKYNLKSRSGHHSQPQMKELSVHEHPKNIKLFAADMSDASKFVNLHPDKFSVKQCENNTDLFLFEFKNDSKCTRVECDGKEVWKHDPSKHGGKNPRSLTYNKKDAKLQLKVCKHTIKYEKDSEGNWKGTELTQSAASLDDATKSLLGSCGISSQQTASSSALSTINLGASSGTSDDAIASLVGYYGIKNVDLTAPTTADIKFFTVDSHDATKTRQLDSSNYDESQDVGDFTYKFKSNVHCTLVKCDNEDVWKKGDNNLNEIKSVTYYKTEKKCVVRDDKNAVLYKLENGSWKFYTKYDLTRRSSGRSGPGTPSHKTSMKQLTVSEYPKKVKLFTEDPNDANTYLEVTTNNYKVEKYERLKEDVYYTLMNGSKCSLVKIDDVEVWKKGEGQMSEPKSLAYNERSNLLRLMDGDKRVTYTKNDHDKWEHFSTESINSTDSTEKYIVIHYKISTIPLGDLLNDLYEALAKGSFEPGPSTETVTHTIKADASEVKHPKFFTSGDNNKAVELGTDKYTVQENTDKKNEFYYKFNDGVKCTLIKCEDKEVWKKNSEFEPKFVRYYKDNGIVVVLDDKSSIFYSLSNNDWKHIANGVYVSDNELVDLDSSDISGDIKLFAIDPSDDNNTIELNNSHFSVKRDIGKVNEFVYEFKPDSNCILIKCNNDSVWRQDPSGDQSKYPKSMNYNKDENTIAVHFDKSVLTYKKDANNNWNIKKNT